MPIYHSYDTIEFMKKWDIHRLWSSEKLSTVEEIVESLLMTRGYISKEEREKFLFPQDPLTLTPHGVGIDEKQFELALERIRQAITKKESIVVYADYDADGITAGAVMWEALYAIGANVMPYIPHRVDEGYGLSQKGIESIIEKFSPTLVITVDHGITAREHVDFLQRKGIDVIITDHHSIPEHPPVGYAIVHTTSLSGSGVSWMVGKAILGLEKESLARDLLGIAAIGTIADMLPLVGVNRQIAKYGLLALENTKRVGLRTLFSLALIEGPVYAYTVSHVIAPRLNALGRLEHALDALRLICTRDQERAQLLAQKICDVNKERQQLTTDTTDHALEKVVQMKKNDVGKRFLFVSDTSYNPGIIGLVAGKLTEHFFLPSVVLAEGEVDGVSKASARSIPGYNIVDAIRRCEDLLIDVGGHPMAAGFTIETKNISELQKRLEEDAQKNISDELLVRQMPIDLEIPLSCVTQELCAALETFAPYGFGNFEPIFVSRHVRVAEQKLVGKEKKHIRLMVQDSHVPSLFSAIGFNLAPMWDGIIKREYVDIAYTMSEQTWNGRTSLQLKLKDIHESIVEK